MISSQLYRFVLSSFELGVESSEVIPGYQSWKKLLQLQASALHLTAPPPRLNTRMSNPLVKSVSRRHLT